MVFNLSYDLYKINTFYLLIGLLSMVYTFCIIHGWIRKYRRRTLPEHPSSKIWRLGVCADLSKTLGIHALAVTFFVLLYTPLDLGLIFYFIYYWFFINRVSVLLLTPEYEVQIIKIKRCYLAS
tara:strand:+ start:502 stop:870 length:369 start_codon:yes stop_codon:yes gene_type:complete